MTKEEIHQFISKAQVSSSKITYDTVEYDGKLASTSVNVDLFYYICENKEDRILEITFQYEKKHGA